MEHKGERQSLESEIARLKLTVQNLKSDLELIRMTNDSNFLKEHLLPNPFKRRHDCVRATRAILLTSYLAMVEDHTTQSLCKFCQVYLKCCEE